MSIENRMGGIKLANGQILGGAFHVHDPGAFGRGTPPGAMVSRDHYAQALGRVERAPVPHVPAWIELFDLQAQCKTEGTNVIDAARELGDEWAAACEGWSRS